jgi:hypothetical protein
MKGSARFEVPHRVGQSTLAESAREDIRAGIASDEYAKYAFENATPCKHGATWPYARSERKAIVATLETTRVVFLFGGKSERMNGPCVFRTPA